MRVLLLTSLLLLSPATRADDDAPTPPVRVTEKDFATWKSLSYSNALVEAWKFRRGSAEQQAKAKVDRDQAFAKSGFSQERFDEVRQTVENAASALQPDADPADRAALDPVTAATTKAHLGEVNENLSSKAEEQVRQEQLHEAAGVAPTAGQLQGRWEIDLDATVEAMVPGMSADLKAEMLGKLKALAGTGYTFGPGNAVEARGAGRVEKGTYRLEGNKLFVLAAGSKREQTMEAGMRGSVLLLGAGVAKSAFRKK